MLTIPLQGIGSWLPSDGSVFALAFVENRTPRFQEFILISAGSSGSCVYKGNYHWRIMCLLSHKQAHSTVMWPVTNVSTGQHGLSLFFLLTGLLFPLFFKNVKSGSIWFDEYNHSYLEPRTSSFVKKEIKSVCSFPCSHVCFSSK